MFKNFGYMCLASTLCFSNAGIAAERLLLERGSSETLAIFVHGFTGDHIETWGKFSELLTEEESLDNVDILFWGYPTKLFSPNEDIGTIGRHLKTEIDYLPKGKYKNIILIAHSMGGLVVRSYIVQALIDGKGDDLSNIRHVVMFGVPNEGINKAKFLPKFINDQIADMNTASQFIVSLRNYWIQRVTTATSSDAYNRNISVTTVAGLEDNFVPKDSVFSYFVSTEITDGDHVSMVKPNTKSHLSYKIVKARLLEEYYELASRSSNYEVATHISGNLKAEHGDLDFSVFLEANKFENGEVKGSYTYDGVGENFRGEIKCFNTSKQGSVTISGPMTTFDQGQPNGWVIMDIRNPENSAGGIRVYSGDENVALEKCRIPGNQYPAKLIDGRVAVEDEISSVWARIAKGEKFKVYLNGPNCPSDDINKWENNDPFGTLACGKHYIARYIVEDDEWNVSGYHEGNIEYRHNVRNSALDSDPNLSKLMLFGAPFVFNEGYEVIDPEKGRVGTLEFYAKQ